MSKESPLNPIDIALTTEQEVYWDRPAFEDLIRAHGVTFIHYSAMRCPVGMIDKDDHRKPHEDHENCSNNFIYTQVGEFTASFIANSTQANLVDVGRMDESNVQITLPTIYDKTCTGELMVPIYIAPFDRLFLKEETVTVVHWQLNQYHITGLDRLDFPATEVLDLMDSQGKRYNCGSDFFIENGNIRWSNNNPGIDANTLKGKVYSVRFLYRPYWYIKRLLHEVRVSQVLNPITGKHEVTRLPQSALLQREYIFRSERNDPESITPDSPRQQAAPESGRFGPR